MERAVPRGDLVALIAPFATEGKKGRQPFAVQTMLRIHFMLQWFTLSGPAMDAARSAAVSAVCPAVLGPTPVR
jgi:IS5 family transposase